MPHAKELEAVYASSADAARAEEYKSDSYNDFRMDRINAP